MLINRYDPEDVFARVPEVAAQTDPVLKHLVMTSFSVPRES